MNVTFRTRLFAAALSVAAAALAIATIIIAWEIRRDERVAIEQRLTDQARLVAELLSQSTAFDSDAALDEEADRLAETIDGRVTWIGIGPHKTTAKDPRGPLVTFDHFVLFDERGPLLHEHAPRLARHMYEGRVRVLFNPSPEEAKEIAGLLRLARKAPPSSGGNAKLTGRTIPCRCGKKHSPSCPNHSTAIRNCKPGRRSARQLSPRLRSHDPC